MAKRDVKKLAARCRELAQTEGLFAALCFARSKDLPNTAAQIAAEIELRLELIDAAWLAYEHDLAREREIERMRAKACAERAIGHELSVLSEAEQRRRMAAVLGSAAA